MLSQMKKVRDWYTVVTNCKSKKVYLKCHHILIVFKHQHVFFLFSFFKDHVLKGHSANMWASTKNPKQSSVSEKGQTRDMWNRRGEPKLFYTHLRFTADVLNFFFLIILICRSWFHHRWKLFYLCLFSVSQGSDADFEMVYEQCVRCCKAFLEANS